MGAFGDVCSIGKIRLKNRLIRSATFEYAASPDGGFSPEHFRIYDDLASGGISTIVTGMVAVSPSSMYSSTMVRAYSDGFGASLPHLERIQREHDCPIIVQLNHCGLKTVEKGIVGHLCGPSDTVLKTGIPVKALGADEIAEIVRDFASAAAKCRDAGMAGVQIHAAHGFLLGQFLSPFYNKRDDGYGGSLENRARFLMEAIDAVRQAVGPDYPVWMKINGEDMTEPGLRLPESIEVCKAAAEKGVDAVECSVGLLAGRDSLCSWPVKDKSAAGYLADAALKPKQAVDAPVISVGGYRSIAGIRKALEMGIEYVSLSRPLIAEPGLAARWMGGESEPARCISCNKCFDPRHPPLSCKIFKSS